MLNFISKYFNYCKKDIFIKTMVSLQLILLAIEIFSFFNGESMIEQFIFIVFGILFYHIIMPLVLYKTGELK